MEKQPPNTDTTTTYAVLTASRKADQDQKSGSKTPQIYRVLFYQLPHKITDQELTFILLSIKLPITSKEPPLISFPKEHLRLPIGSRVVQVNKELHDALVKQKNIEIREKWVLVISFEGDKTIFRILNMYKDRVLCVKGVPKYNDIDDTVKFVEKKVAKEFEEIFFPQDKNNKNREFFYVILADRNSLFNYQKEGSSVTYKKNVVTVQKYRMPNKFQNIFKNFGEKNIVKKKAKIVRTLFRGIERSIIAYNTPLYKRPVDIRPQKGRKMVLGDLNFQRQNQKEMDTSGHHGHLRMLQGIIMGGVDKESQETTISDNFRKNYKLNNLPNLSAKEDISGQRYQNTACDALPVDKGHHYQEK